MREPLDFDKEVLVHVHIPKTGGTSLHTLLSETLGAQYVARLGSEKLAHWRRSWTEELQWRALFAARKLYCTAIGSHPLAEGMGRAELNALKAMTGHFGLGAEPQIDKRPVYIGLLRDPHDRMLSEYHYIAERVLRGSARPNPRSLIHDPKLGPPRSLGALLDRLERRAIPNWRNAQCRHFHPSATFEAARAVIEAKDTVFAPLEDAEGFGAAVGRLVGGEIDMTTRRNVSRTRSGSREDGEPERARIARHFEEDQRLYDYVRQRWAR